MREPCRFRQGEGYAVRDDKASYFRRSRSGLYILSKHLNALGRRRFLEVRAKFTIIAKKVPTCMNAAVCKLQAAAFSFYPFILGYSHSTFVLSLEI